ncbi:MAG: MG2 domain-containing protein, partial [Promethearchaeota archaeon]
MANSYYNNDNVLTLNLDKYVITPGEPITINLGLTGNLTASPGKVITVEIYKGFYRNYYYYYHNYYEIRTPIYTGNLTTDTQGLVSTVFSSTSSQGIYTVYAYTEDCRTFKEFTVGEVGIFYKGPVYYKANQEYSAAVHVVNLTDFTGMALADFNYSISYYEYSLSNWVSVAAADGQTDITGYALINTDIPIEVDDYHVLRLTIQTQNREAEYQTFLYETWDYYYYCMWGGQKVTNRERFQYVVTTDKTIYSPGETISLRVLVLEYSFMNETKQPLKHTPVSFTIYNPSEFAVYWSTLSTDENGIITFKFPLDEDCELGYYGFEFGQGNGVFRYDVKVEYYTKPAYRVNINTNGKEFYPHYENLFKGYVEVEYYFGQPVVGATVNLSIKTYLGDLIHNIEGHTNNEGLFHFSINLSPIPELYYTFNVEASVTDIYGREASTEKTFTRIEELFAYGYLTNWAPHPEEELEYYFYVYQYIISDDGYGFWNWNYNPLSNISVEINIYGITDYPWYSPIITSRELLASFSRYTNEFGAGKLEFQLALEDIKSHELFEIQLVVELDDGRSYDSSYYFRYKKYSLDINIIDSNIDLGQTLEFEVTYKDILTGLSRTGLGRIYIYDANHQLIGRVTDLISGSKTYNLLIPGFYPEGRYYIYSYVYSRSDSYYGGFSYHSAHQFFKVGSFQSISITTNFTNVGTYYNNINVELGDVIEISGRTNVSSNMPYYLEIYKRGLIFSTQISLVGDTFIYLLPVNAFHTPDFSIMVYTISDQGKLYESSVNVHVVYTFNLTLSTDKEIYEPGDSITVTITPSDNITSVIALSFIDSAVLDVEPEDDSELAYFTMNPYSTYIRSGSSWGSGFDAISYSWFDYGMPTGGAYRLEEDVFFYPYFYDRYAFLEVGPTQIDAPSFDDLLTDFDTDIRKNISESANWKPRMIINESTNITFKLPDNIGEWTIRAVVSTFGEDSGDYLLYGDVITTHIKSFLPFFIEFELPQPIVQDDILSVKGYVYNYIGTDVRAVVAIDAPNLIVLNNEVQQLFIPNGFVSEVEFSIYCAEPYLQNVTLLAATEAFGDQYSDAKLLTTYIEPNGIKIVNRTIGFLNATQGSIMLNYTLDPLSVYHSETLALYTNLMDISIDSWQSLIGYPYGCIEQTISKVLPTALIYNYLNSTGQLTSKLEQEITLMILEGLSRIYNFQHSDGGWGWWRDDQSKIIMTAIVVSALINIEETGFHVNSLVLENGIGYLIAQQFPNGLWDFQQYSSNTLEATAFILKAIMGFKHKTSQMNTSISKAITEFMTSWNSGEMKSTYAASLFYITTADSSYVNNTFNSELIQFIKDNKKVEDNTVYWDADTSNNWYWRKLGNIIEITSYAAWALTLDDFVNNYALIQKAVRYILNQRNRWGWRSTADTAAAITALTAIKIITFNGGLIDFNGTISVNINNNDPAQFQLNYTGSSTTPNDILLNLRECIIKDLNKINITLEGTGNICYIFESTQILRSNPEIEIPEMIEVVNNEQFNITVGFTEIDSRMPISDTLISLIDVPEDLQDPEENYIKYIPVVFNGTEISFSLKAPDKIILDTGIIDYIIEGVKVLGFIQFSGTTDDSSSYQLFHRTVGPIIVRLGSHSSSFPSAKPFNGIAPNNNGSLSLEKHLSYDTLNPGDIIDVVINITNDGDSCQFYVLEDKLPTGTIFLSDTVKISGDSVSSEITNNLFRSGIHLFFPLLATGKTEIRYKVQVEKIKNSYSGQCKLWGMYDEVRISTQSEILEVIPRKYYTNHSIYKDQS